MWLCGVVCILLTISVKLSRWREIAGIRTNDCYDARYEIDRRAN